MNKTLVRKYKTVVDLSIKRRGEIIEEFTYVEMVMDIIISRFFCDTTDKTNEFTSVFLSIVDFSKKKEVIYYILECNKEFLKKNSSIKSDMDKINSTRNIFAHKYLAIHDENIKSQKLGYIKFKNGKATEVEITNDYFEDQLNLIEKVTDILTELSIIVKSRKVIKTQLKDAIA